MRMRPPVCLNAHFSLSFSGLVSLKCSETQAQFGFHTAANQHDRTLGSDRLLRPQQEPPPHAADKLRYGGRSIGTGSHRQHEYWNN